MKRFLLAAILPLFLACGGGGSSTPTPTPKPPVKTTTGFTLKMSATSASKPTSTISPMVAVDNAQVQLLMGITANQGETLATGYSATPKTTDSYTVTTTLNDGLNNGLTLGFGGVSQTFAGTDLSFLLPDGGVTAPTGNGTVPVANGNLGLIMASFSATGNTTLNMTAQASNLPQVDEIVLRLATYSIQQMTNGGSLVVCPHVIYNNTLYTDENRTLTVSKQYNEFVYMQYILFAPASKIGAGASYFVTPAGANNNYTVIDPSANADPTIWINMTGNEGLKAAIDAMVTAQNNPLVTETSLATYFQAYFTKFSAAGSTVFTNSSGPNGVGWLGNGSQASASFEIIALDDSKGPLQINGQSSLAMVWDSSNTIYDLNQGILDLEGQPPIQFTTALSQN